jgi:hypothetical protein
MSSAILVGPPFAPDVIENILRYSRLPSLVNPLELLAGINPATLASVLSNTENTQESEQNPIADIFPDYPSGTINGTYAVLPIDYKLARRIIPSRYGILKKAIRKALPRLPKGKYPVRTNSPDMARACSDIRKVGSIDSDRPRCPAREHYPPRLQRERFFVLCVTAA